MDKMNALRYFLKVCETSSFTEAGKLCSVPSSSISRRIGDLETQLGVMLFQRSTRSVRLTALGQIYRDHVQSAVRALDHADALMTEQREAAAGVLRISAQPGYGRVRLLPALDKFRKRYPDIVVDVELTDRPVDLARSEVDIAIRASATLPDRAVAKKLSTHRFRLLAAPKYIRKHGRPKTPDDLQDHRCLLYRGPKSVLHWQIKEDDVWRQALTSPSFIANDGVALVDATLAGEGIALLPEWGVEEQLASGALKEIKIPNVELSVSRESARGIFLIYLRPRYGMKKVKLAVEFLLGELSPAPHNNKQRAQSLTSP